jgi:hypothetical protein
MTATRKSEAQKALSNVVQPLSDVRPYYTADAIRLSPHGSEALILAKHVFYRTNDTHHTNFDGYKKNYSENAQYLDKFSIREA